MESSQNDPISNCSCSKFKHALQEPSIQLPCGHKACKTCLPGVNSSTKCISCETDIDENTIKIELKKESSNGIKSNVKETSIELKKQYSNVLQHLNSKISYLRLCMFIFFYTYLIIILTSLRGVKRYPADN